MTQTRTVVPTKKNANDIGIDPKQKIISDREVQDALLVPAGHYKTEDDFTLRTEYLRLLGR
jgi:hypothetical protein